MTGKVIIYGDEYDTKDILALEFDWDVIDTANGEST